MSDAETEEDYEDLPPWLVDPTLPAGYRSMVRGELLNAGDLYTRDGTDRTRWRPVPKRHHMKRITPNDEEDYRFARPKTALPMDKRFSYRTLGQTTILVQQEVWRVEAMVSCNYRELACQICGGDARVNMEYLRGELHRHLGGTPQEAGEYEPRCQACELLEKVDQVWESETNVEGPGKTRISRLGPKLDGLPIELRTEIRQHCRLEAGAAVPFTQYDHLPDCHAVFMRDQLLMLARHAGIFLDSRGLDSYAYACWKGEE